jgi:hypothetical protein
MCEVSSAVIVSIPGCWNVKLCRLVVRYQCKGQICGLLRQGRRMKADKDSTILRYEGLFLPNCTASYPRRLILLTFCLIRFPTSPFCTQSFSHCNVLLIHYTAVSMDVIPLDRMSLSVRFQTMTIIKYSATEVIFCFSEHQSSVSLSIFVT